MVRTRLFVMAVIGGLVLATVGAVAAPPTAKPKAEPVPLAKAIVLTVQEIGEGIAALHKALPPLSPRLEPVEETLKGLREAFRDREEVEVKEVYVEILKLDLQLHRLLFDLEREARELAELRNEVKEFVERFTSKMDPRLAEQVREFARGLLALVGERAAERQPGMAKPEELARIVGKLRADLNRLDFLLLQFLDVRLEAK